MAKMMKILLALGFLVQSTLAIANVDCIVAPTETKSCHEQALEPAPDSQLLCHLSCDLHSANYVLSSIDSDAKFPELELAPIPVVGHKLQQLITPPYRPPAVA